MDDNINEDIAPASVGEIRLEPLIVDDSGLQTEYRRRRVPSHEKTIHIADLELEEANGWVLKRALKRKAKVSKPKTHDQILEDRVWCMCKSMGYKILNGAHFNIEFEFESGTFSRKQIDVYAEDDETVLIVECKSKQSRGKRSLQKDIMETISLKRYIRSTIYNKNKNNKRPKIIWIYATNNIIWSDNDLARAEEGDIYVLTENELQYFEAFLKHVGTAGRFQILGEFLKNQKVPGLSDNKLPAIKGKIGGQTFYSFVTTPRSLLKIAFVNHQALNHPDGKPAYQRMLSSKRIKDIGEFIKSGGYFPTNILINFLTSPRFDISSNKENSDDTIKFGWLTLPSVYRSAWVIDGQHRLYGYSDAPESHLDDNIFVLAFDGMETHREADLFININHKQKSVSRSLLVSLLADIRMGDSDPKTALTALASAVIRAVNTDKTSPLSRRFVTHGIAPEQGQNLTVSEAVNGLSRSELLGRAVGRNRVPGPICGATDDDTVKKAKTILNIYFEALRNSNPQRWEAGRLGHICTNPGIRAHLMLIAEIVRYLTINRDVDFYTLNEKKFGEYVSEIAEPIHEFVARENDDTIALKFSRKFGEGGVKEYYYNLLEIINEKRGDFGPPEFKEWLEKRESTRVDEALSFVMKLSEILTDYVVDTLKSIHGTRQLPSGDPAFWELGIESRRVKDNAYRKQQEDAADRRKSKEAYLDVIDLEEIVRQKNNWDHFEYVFNLPMPGEKNGKKYYLSWISKYNELRRVAAHKNNLRTYSDDDLEFLDWLRGEIVPKLGEF